MFWGCVCACVCVCVCYDQKQQHTHTHAHTPRTHRNSILQLHCIYMENCKPSGIPNAQKQIVIDKVLRHA